MLRTLQRITDHAVNAISILGGLLMVLMTLVVFSAVVSRYFFDLPIRSTGEMSGLIFAWLVFLTAIAVTHHEDNIAVTYFRGLLPTAVQWVAEVLTKLIMLGFVVVILVSSIQMSITASNQLLPSLRISSIWLNISVAVAFAPLVLVLLLQVVVSIMNRSTDRRGGDEAPASPEEGAEEVKGIE